MINGEMDMSDFIKEMNAGILQKNVIRRNVAIDSLKGALKELKKGRREINRIATDPCHINSDNTIREDYSCVIREIESLIRIMTGGDWCFSVNNTVEREEEIENGEITEK